MGERLGSTAHSINDRQPSVADTCSNLIRSLLMRSGAAL